MTLATWTRIQNQIVCVTAVDWSLENVRHVLLPRHGTSPGTISVHAPCPPSRQMGSSLCLPSPVCHTYLRHLFSLKLCDCILGDPITRSSAISTQTFSNRKMLKMNSFAYTVAMSAAVSSMSAPQFTRCAGDITASDRHLSA